MSISHTHIGGGAAAAGGGVGLGGLHDTHEHVRDHLPDRVPHGGESVPMFDHPLNLIFPDPATVPASDHIVALQAIALPGGITMSLVALVAIACLVLVLTSALIKTVVVKCCTP